MLCNRCRESNHVVLHFRLDFVDAINRERRAASDFGGVVLGDDALFGERFNDRQLDVQPSLIFILVLPDLAHLGPRVPRYHNHPL